MWEAVANMLKMLQKMLDKACKDVVGQMKQQWRCFSIGANQCLAVSNRPSKPNHPVGS